MMAPSPSLAASAARRSARPSYTQRDVVQRLADELRAAVVIGGRVRCRERLRGAHGQKRRDELDEPAFLAEQRDVGCGRTRRPDTRAGETPVVCPPLER